MILDLLAARYRLGETFWTLSRRHARAMQALEGEGLITVRNHNASPNHVYASLTEAGKAIALSPTYTPPLPATTNPFEQIGKLAKQAEKLYGPAS